MKIRFIYAALFLISCREAQNAGTSLVVVNIPQIQLGSQVWMTKNLEVTTFNNGEPIPQVTSDAEWEKAGKEGRPAWCYYNNDSTTSAKYGRMYNWYALNDPRGLAPQGWHIPTNQEWITLEEFFGIPDAGTRMKCDTALDNTNPGKNNPGFCAVLGGYRDRNGRFTGMDEFTYLSGITQDTMLNLKEDERFFIWGRGLHHANSTVMRCGLDKKFGLYVRCIKN
jgi:uncharacterized protein (TIGR02145 family)